MMSRARITSLLREFFVDQEMEVEVAGGSLDLVVRDGRNIVGVKIIDTPLVRDEVERLIAGDLEEYDKVYVAVPSKYITLLPPLDVLKAARLGVLEVAREGVRIVISAPFRGSRRYSVDEGEVRELVEVLRGEIEKMRARVERISILEERIKRLEERVSRLERAYKSRGEGVERERVVAEVASGGGKPVEGDMPSFVTDNPWLSVLSRRSGR